MKCNYGNGERIESNPLFLDNRPWTGVSVKHLVCKYETFECTQRVELSMDSSLFGKARIEMDPHETLKLAAQLIYAATYERRTEPRVRLAQVVKQQQRGS